MYSQKFINRFNLKWHLDRITGCWMWHAAIAGKGYGNIGLERQRKQVYAHRASYEIHVGEIPKGRYVLHKCDNPGCVNPEHLFLGDAGANARDMAAKGRHLFGERNTESKLNESDVRKIRQLCEDGMKQAKIAQMYGICQMTVSRIHRRERWQHIK